jgi:hypothetical protein
MKDELVQRVETHAMNAKTTAPRIAVIGYGAVADEMVRCLEARGEIAALAGILVRPEGSPSSRTKPPAGLRSSMRCHASWICSRISWSKQPVMHRSRISGPTFSRRTSIS